MADRIPAAREPITRTLQTLVLICSRHPPASPVAVPKALQNVCRDAQGLGRSRQSVVVSCERDVYTTVSKERHRGEVKGVEGSYGRGEGLQGPREDNRRELDER